ncbi:MAG: WYL domain-containing protein, partial [Clostridia bacterium]|nr:WYL domain-containing protein [Clostridia bacterium]
MAKQRNQKLKLVCLIDIMEKYTDEEHGLTMPEIIEKLAAYDISAERKSIYEDFELLRSHGFDIGSFHQNG